jgi:hypothetical protein
MSTGTLLFVTRHPISKAYREFDGHHPLIRFPLDGNATINTARRTSEQVMRTVHNDLDILHKAIHELERLCRSRLSLLSRQPVQPLQDRFHIILAEQFLPKFLCITMCY